MTVEQYRQSESYRGMVSAARLGTTNFGLDLLGEVSMRATIKAITGAILLKMVPKDIRDYFLKIIAASVNDFTILSEDDKYWLITVCNTAFKVYDDINPGQVFCRIVDLHALWTGPQEPDVELP